MPTASRERRFVALGFLAVVVVRLLVVELAFRGPYNPYELPGDMRLYVALGISLERGEGFSIHYAPLLRQISPNLSAARAAMPPAPTFRRFIGYPLFLAGVFSIVGYNLHVVLWLQAIVSAVTALIVYFLAREVGNKTSAAMAFALAIVYYPMALDAAFLLPETLVSFWITLGAYTIVRYVKDPGVRTGLWSGLVIGVAVVVKATALPLAPIGLGLAYLRKGRARAATVGALAFVAVMAVVLAPVAIRNHHALGRFSFLPSYSGSQLIQLQNPYNDQPGLYLRPGWVNGGFAGLRRAFAEATAQAGFPANATPNEYELDDAYARYAWAFMVRDPVQALRNAGLSFVNLWRLDYREANWVRKTSNWICYVAMVPFFFLGSWTAVRRVNPMALVLVLFVASFVIMHAIVAAEMRYRTGVMPVFFVLAGLGLAGEWFRSGGSRAIDD